MAVMLAAATIIVFTQVIFRYFLLQPLSWSEESARFLFIWISLLGAALAVKGRAHFAITMVTSRFPASVQKTLELLVAVAASFIFSILVTEGWTLVLLNRNQRSPAIEVLMSIPYAAIPIGGALALFFLWADLALHWNGEATSNPDGDEPVLGAEKLGG